MASTRAWIAFDRVEEGLFRHSSRVRDQVAHLGFSVGDGSSGEMGNQEIVGMPYVSTIANSINVL